MEDKYRSEYYSRVAALASDTACVLLKTGSPVNVAERAVTVICLKSGAAAVSAMCVPDAVMLSVNFYGRQYTSLKRVYYVGNDLYVQEKCLSLVRDYSAGRLTLHNAEKRLRQISTSHMAAKDNALGCLLACGSFAVFFGGNAADGILSAVAGLIGGCLSELLSKRGSGGCLSELLSKRGSGGCARVFLLSAVSGFITVLLCALLQAAGISCHTSVVLVGTLMPLIPGLMVCNALSDLISGEIFSGVYRIFRGLAQTVCIVAGYALALAASGGLSAFTLVPPRADALHIMLCYISCAAGAAGFCLTMNVHGRRLLFGVGAAAASYTVYVVARTFVCSEFIAYFAAAVAAYAAAEVPSRVIRIPSDVFVTPAVIPLLPGASLYFAVNAIVCGDAGTALACGGNALSVFTAIAAGLAAAGLALRIIFTKKQTML